MNPLARDEIKNILEEFATQIRPARTAPPPTPFDWYDVNSAALQPLEQTTRAREEREVQRIVAWYAWGPLELRRLLDKERCELLSDTADRALQRILTRMRELEDACQTGCDVLDKPPA